MSTNSKLIIDLVTLPLDEKAEIKQELDPAQLEVEFDDYHFKSNLAVHGLAEKMTTVLVFKGNVKSTVEKICSRCLEPITTDVQEPFDLTYDIKGKTVVDVTGDMRETMIFAHPLNFLCKENCKGLCAGCGANLNIESCKCSKSKEGK